MLKKIACAMYPAIDVPRARKFCGDMVGLKPAWAKGVAFANDMIHGPDCRMRACLDSEGNAIPLHQLNRT